MNKIGKSFFVAARRMAFFGLLGLLMVTVTRIAHAQSYKYAGASNGLTSHLTFQGGGGFTPAVGGTSKNINLGWNLGFGGGYMLNKKFGMLIDYNFYHNSIPQAILNQVQEPGGYYHFWSFTADPIYNYWQGSKLGGYAIGGGGFSRKVVSFTQPFQSTYCDPYFGCYPITVNQVVYHFSSNQPVVDLGTGITYRFSPYNRVKFFTEIRYVKLFSTASQIPGQNASLLPITFGIRW